MSQATLKGMKQKQGFVLIEVFIAIALLSLSAFPLISASLHSYQLQKNQLFALELERQAELHFYQVLKESIGDLSFDQISSRPSLWTPFKELKVQLGEVKQTFYPHYHLYYYAQSKSPTHKKLFCSICFPTQKNRCPNSRKKGAQSNQKTPYVFCVLVKKVVEN